MAYQEWLTPKFTSAAAVNGVSVSASSQYNTSYVPWRAFNQTNTSNIDCWLSIITPSYPQYLNITFPSPVWVVEFQLQERVGSIHGPKSYNIQIYDAEAAGWTTIYSAVDEVAGAAGDWRPAKTVTSILNKWTTQVRLEILSSYYTAYVAVGQFKVSGYDNVIADYEVTIGQTVTVYGWDITQEIEGVTFDSLGIADVKGLEVTYEQAFSEYIKARIPITANTLWAFEVKELAEDAEVLVGAVPATETGHDGQEDLPGIVRIPAEDLTETSVILCRFNPVVKKQLEVYIDGVFYAHSVLEYVHTDDWASATREWAIVLSDANATDSCSFVFHTGREEIPTLADIWETGINWNEGLPYDTFTWDGAGGVSIQVFREWLVAIPTTTFFLGKFLADENFVQTVWLDTQIGLDTNLGGMDSPFLTIQKCIDTIADNVKGCVVLKAGSVVTGAVNTNGLLNILATKNITFIGDFVNPEDTPKIIATNYAAIRNLSADVRFFRLKIYSAGTASAAYNTSAVVLGMTGATASTKFYNCYFEPYGVRFVWGATAGETVLFENCIINFASKAYTLESHGALPTVQVMYRNCLLIGAFVQRMTAAQIATINAEYCTYSASLPSFPFAGEYDVTNSNFMDSTMMLQPVTNAISVEKRINWQSSGVGLNVDGTPSHRGVYGGQCAWAPVKLGPDGGYNSFTGVPLLDVEQIGSNVSVWSIGLPDPQTYLTFQYYSHEGSSVKLTQGKRNYGG